MKATHSKSSHYWMGSSAGLVAACGLMIVLITVMIYIPALNNGFVWDDDLYVYENNYIRSLNPQTLSWMLTAFHAGNWHPLTWFSHAADYLFWGLDPFGHHLTGIILHGLNTLLVFLLVAKLVLVAQGIPAASFPSHSMLPITLKPVIVAGMTALFFGCHPLHVESVAWVAERKDVLCAFFFLLSLIAYLAFATVASNKERRTWYATCMTLFICALMSKPMAVTLPLVLLLLDFYPLRRFTLAGQGKNINPRPLFEKIPFLALSAIASIITIWAQHAAGAIQNLERLPMSIRLINALHSPWFYIKKMFWPVNLVPFYPFAKPMHFADTQYTLAAIMILLVTGYCLWMLKRGNRLFFTVWSFYLLTLVPVSGIVQVGIQAAADRYTYLPGISIFVLGGIGFWGLCAQAYPVKNKLIVGGVLAVVSLIFLCLVTRQQIKIWQNSEILWGYVIKHFPGRVALAHNNLGLAYDDQGRYDKAMAEYEKAVAINPYYADAWNNLGFIYHRKGMLDEAIARYQKALSINPTLAKVYNNLGFGYYQKGMFDEAIAHYKKALAIIPDYAKGRHNLGLAYYAQGMFDQAIVEYEKALAASPYNAKVQYNLGQAYHAKGMYDAAIARYQKTLDLNPNYAEAHNNLGIIYYKARNYSLAQDHLDKALALGYKVDPEMSARVKANR